MKPRPLLFSLVVMGLLCSAPASFGSYSDSPLPPDRANDDKTAPNYKIPGKPNPTTEELIEELKLQTTRQPSVAEIAYQLGLAYAQQGKLEQAVEALQTAVKLDPRHVLAWNNLGANLSDLGKQDEALRAFQTAVQIDPRNGNAWNGLATVYSKSHRFDESGAALSEGFKVDPNSRRLWNTLGNLRCAQLQFNDAVDAFNHAIQIDPEYAIGWCNLGFAEDHLGRVDDAITHMQKAVDIDPKLAQGWINLVRVYEEKGPLAKSDEAARHAVALIPNQPILWAVLGNHRYLLGQWEEAVENYMIAVDRLGFKNAPTIGKYGESAAHIGHMDDAEKLIKEAQDLDPHDSDVLANVGMVRYLQKRTDEARDAFQKSLEIDPKKAEALCGLGMCSLLDSKPADAIPYFQKALAIWPDNLKAWNGLAGCYQLTGNRQEALKAFRKLTYLQPSLAAFWQGLAQTSDDKQEVEKAANQAVSLDPKDIVSFRLLGLIEQQLNKGAEAETACRSALALSGADSRDWNSLGCALLIEKKFDDAQAAFEKATSLGANLTPQLQANSWTGLADAHLGNAPKGSSEIQAAADAYNKALELNPNAPFSWYKLGYCEKTLGHDDQLKAAIAKLNGLARDPKNDFSLIPIEPPASSSITPDILDQAKKMAEHGQGPQALPILWQSLQTAPDDVKLQQDTIEALLASHRYAQALQIAQKATIDHPDQAGSWLFLGQVNITAQRYDEAEAVLIKANGINPKMGPSWFFLGYAYTQQKKFDEAKEALTKSLDLTPENTKAWQMLAHCYGANHDAAGWQAKLESLTQAHPDAATGWIMLAGIQMTRGAKDDAMASVQKAVDLKPADPEIWCSGIGMVYIQLNQPDKAIDAFNQALKINPNYDEALNNLGYALFSQGKVDEAIEDYKKALQSNPRHQRALYNLTTAYQKEGLWNLAKDTCDKLAQLDPGQAAQLSKNFPGTTSSPTQDATSPTTMPSTATPVSTPQPNPTPQPPP